MLLIWSINKRLSVLKDQPNTYLFIPIGLAILLPKIKARKLYFYRMKKLPIKSEQKEFLI